MTHDQGVRLICGVISAINSQRRSEQRANLNISLNEISSSADHLQYTQAMGVLGEVAEENSDGILRDLGLIRGVKLSPLKLSEMQRELHGRG